MTKLKEIVCEMTHSQITTTLYEILPESSTQKSSYSVETENCYGESSTVIVFALHDIPTEKKAMLAFIAEVKRVLLDYSQQEV